MVKHILDTRQFRNRDFIDGFILKTKEIKENIGKGFVYSQHRGRVVCGLFFEPSTRTRTSFESAAARLGATPVFTENAAEFSSVYKGETLEHTILATQSNYDALVIRHPDNGSALRAAKVSKKPVINAGDGGNQHPSQALLDIFTIYEKFGKIDNLKIGFLGDLKNGRTVKSLTYLLAQFSGSELYYASPKSLELPSDIREWLKRKNIKITETENVLDFLSIINVLYVTRIQQERLSEEDFEKLAASYDDFIIDFRKANMMKEGSIIMHPLPINREKSHGKPEITPAVDSHPRAWYFVQSGNGVYARMALLDIVLNKKDLLHDLIIDMEL